MPEKQFNIYVTDGARTWAVFFITYGNKGDFYLGPLSPIIQLRWSRHALGQLRQHVGEESSPMGSDRQKLPEFAGIEQLPVLGIPKSAFEEGRIGLVPSGRKMHGGLFLDLRTLSDTINILPFLLDPKHAQRFADIAQQLWPNCQITIFTHTRPWLVVVAG